ncbi:MAG: biotin/lipoyl-containing protein [Pyrinomonadaceae bacterium]
MKLQAKVGDDVHDIEFTKSDDKVVAMIDDRRYELEALEPEPYIALFKNGSRVYEAFVSPPPNASSPVNVRVGTYEMDIQIIDPQRLRSSAGAVDQTDGVVEIKTAMPGKVVRILKSVGDAVEKGEGVIVVEAMKMQNEMRSPRDGVIKSLKFAEGENVAAGEVLVVIE